MIIRKTQIIRGKGKYLWILPGIIILFIFWFSIPDPLFNDPVSTVVLDRGKRLLGAKISDDQQWRFPDIDSVPEKFTHAITCYEDKYFNFHPGVNLPALVRAGYLNIKNRKVISGGSTLTMQVIRMSRKNRPRSYFEKAIEIMMAFRLELTYSKGEILHLYTSHAPFGGNVVGLEAAAWRYFGRESRNLSWAEAATLAVLPNSPGLIYPGRNPGPLLSKRNRLLHLLLQEGTIDSLTYQLAISEQLPLKPFPLPRMAPHLLNRAIIEGRKGTVVNTSLDYFIQERVLNILAQHSVQLRANEIYNAAAIVVEVNSGQVVAYVGNIPGETGKGNYVDLIRAPRSSGSILKPLLYAAMLKDGLLLPNTLIPDIPMQIGGFIPENFNLTYDGAVPAKHALARSLNIPAVKMLQNYGYDQFYSLLKKGGITTLNKPADHYGLSLILGGAEIKLWDLAGIYASMARKLNKTGELGEGYLQTEMCPPRYYFEGQKRGSGKPGNTQIFDAASIWLTFEAMIEVARPDEELQWQRYASSQKIAWKTGTSFGNRDAWSVGVTPKYVVGVWVGNATGEGRPGLTGIGVAAPVLFDIFKLLPSSAWFSAPEEEMIQIPVCRLSGHRASDICEPIDTMWVQKAGLKTAVCPYHQLIHLDETGKYQVNSACESPDKMQHVSWFVLPPVQEWYFRNKNPFYKVLPSFKPGCQPLGNVKNMDMIYPKNRSSIYIPVDLGGKQGYTVFKVAHRNPDFVIYWHLDEQFIGTTHEIHQKALSPKRGDHRLLLIDQNGETLSISFEVLTKSE
jgi:penicillin-binding protein 1C